jgi:SAM-dependent methyltransferase
VSVADELPLYGPAARHYLRGRPPYSDQLLAVLTAELGLDGDGRLLDVGCGPGVLAVQLAPAFREVVGLDPDAAMLEEAARHAGAHGVSATWIEAPAERLPELGLAPVRLATFGQSFHWTERDIVAEAVFDVLEPGGSIAIVLNDIDHGLAPSTPPAPPIPHEALRELVRRYLGPQDRAGSGLRPAFTEPSQDAIVRSRFGTVKVLHAPGRADIVRDVDGVIAGYLSTSFAAPQQFGDALDDFVGDARELLLAASPDGRFWDWPGDTWILVATKPSG